MEQILIGHMLYARHWATGKNTTLSMALRGSQPREENTEHYTQHAGTSEERHLILLGVQGRLPGGGNAGGEP